jgi:hypothetical protein
MYEFKLEKHSRCTHHTEQKNQAQIKSLMNEKQAYNTEFNGVQRKGYAQLKLPRGV